jgi:hypothetical protein
MASTISQGVENVVNVANNAISEKKKADLQRDTVDVQDKKHLSTTDFGTKVATQDDWLRVVSEDRAGKQNRYNMRPAPTC